MGVGHCCRPCRESIDSVSRFLTGRLRRSGALLVCMEVPLISEAIERVKAAESKAEERGRAARGEAKQIVADARQAGEKLLEEMKKEVREAEKKVLEEARSAAGQEAEEAKLESRAAVEAVGADAEKRVGKGVTRVLDSIAAAASREA